LKRKLNVNFNPKESRRLALKLTAISVAPNLLMHPKAWASFPDKPMKIIVPWAPGGSTDSIARAIAGRLGETLGKAVVVDNRPGAAGQIGTDAAAKSVPDGYTLALVELPHAIAPSVVAKLPYDLLRDFAPITMIGTSPLVLFAGMGPENKDFKEFIKTANKLSAPPAIAHSGSGSISHLAGELLTAKSKIKFNLVPYRGSAPALTDVASGIVAAHFATLASGAPLLAQGKIRALAVTSQRRINLPGLENVPTLTELGIKDMEINQWWAMVAPATTPIDIIEKLRIETIAALNYTAVKERLSTLGVELKGSSRDDLRAFMRTETFRWADIAKSIGLQPQ
jgi:tripartite-type tricarboxylate transporter receptor subunit TctC